jgi:hypothetical protein
VLVLIRHPPFRHLSDTPHNPRAHTRRSFATSLRRPPFSINYTGVLFRSYPGNFRALLVTGDGQKKQTAATEQRPTNKAFRDSLTQSLVVPGVCACVRGSLHGSVCLYPSYSTVLLKAVNPHVTYHPTPLDL